jgi:NAD(P)-dependent dehydrogenase (short-subunit alcohol dehydrogenase family)
VGNGKTDVVQICDSVALVTGANRGLGAHFVAELRRRGARRIYASARDPRKVNTDGVRPVALDVTDGRSIAEAVNAARDTTLLINNAGVYDATPLLNAPLEAIRREIDTNLWGTLSMIRAFGPTISANGGGAIIDVLSLLSWAHYPDYGAYSVSKAAAWAMGNVLRQELAPLGVQLTALHVGYMDTDMVRHITSAKADPADVAAATLDAVEADQPEVIFGSPAAQVKASLAGPLAGLYPDLGLPDSLHVVHA